MKDFLFKLAAALVTAITSVLAIAWVSFCVGIGWSIAHRAFQLGSF